MKSNNQIKLDLIVRFLQDFIEAFPTHDNTEIRYAIRAAEAIGDDEEDALHFFGDVYHLILTASQFAENSHYTFLAKSGRDLAKRLLELIAT